ncbi:MAG: tRNA (adenosine(37)-N6)-dimethylallyltransferase MiaA [Actinomycetota bacterium]
MAHPEAQLSRLPVLAIVGPTASGKSMIAMAVAEALGLEIVSIDSMTIYRGLDIGTAKPSEADRERVPHHLIDIADPKHPYNVSQFQMTARAAISDIHARNRVPLLVGGAGLYFRAVVDDLRFPPADELVRTRLETQDPAELRARLATHDPRAAETVDLSNLRRVVRALEVIEITGSPFSAFRASWDSYESRYELSVIGLRTESDELDRRIRDRTRAMIRDGLLDEVRRLLGSGAREYLTASRAIAYRQIVSHLDGEITLDDAVEQIVIATRQYARRQMVWFRKDPRVEWLDSGPSADAAVLARFRAAIDGSGIHRESMRTVGEGPID